MAGMSKRKQALITGITGQDGSYLAELLEKGTTPCASSDGQQLQHHLELIIWNPHDLGEHGQPPGLTLHYGDLSDGTTADHRAGAAR